MKKIISIQLVLLFLPAIFSLFAAIYSNVFLLVFSIIIMFALVFLFPIARGRENLWILILSAITLSPINIRLITYIVFDTSYLDYSKFTVFFASVLIFFVLLSVEEIIFGIVVRIMRPHQYDFDE